jgi:hypothetical protein
MGGAVKAPEGAQEIGLGEDVGGLAGEVQEQGVLARAESDGVLVEKDGARAGVDV